MPARTANIVGPDFITSLAEQQLAHGLETDATMLRANAKAWNEDRIALAAYASTVDRLRRAVRTLRRTLMHDIERALEAAEAANLGSGANPINQQDED